MKNKLIMYSACLLAILIASQSAYSLSQQPSLQSLSESIHALNITRNKSLTSLSELDSVKNKSLHNEYSIFVEYLSFRIKKYCSQLSEFYGVNSISNLPCPNNMTYSQSLDKNSYITSDEKIQSLDDELMSAMGDFDEMLLEEHEKIAQISQKKTNSNDSASSEQNAAGGSNAYKQSEKEADSDSDKKNDDDKTSKNQTTQAKRQSEKNSNKNSSSKGKQSGGSKNYKKRTIDKADDDIVARQLKEAAENETDPELKKKLWAEYEKYKNNKI